MRRIVRAVAVAAVVAAGTALAPGQAFADDDAWSYWGDGVSAGTGERSTIVDDGGITPSNCTLTFRVKRYVDLPGTPGWLEPAADLRCNAHPGVAGNVYVAVYDDAGRQVLAKNPAAGGPAVLRANTASVRSRYTGQRGHHCFTAQGIKNGSYTGAGHVQICGTW